jgi:hypothetical protein
VRELGAHEVIYAAKLGALTGPHDLYQRIFCPSTFVIMNHDRIVFRPPSPPNGVLTKNPKLDSGCHVSIPTVLEEDYSQREVTMQLKATSIDNEISQMARAISAYNNSALVPVKFSAVHLATDYVRTPDDKAVQTLHDLKRNRSPEALVAKAAIIKRIVEEVIISYWLDQQTQS